MITEVARRSDVPSGWGSAACLSDASLPFDVTAALLSARKPSQVGRDTRARGYIAGRRLPRLFCWRGLVVGVLHQLADVHAARGEMQKFVGARVGGEPVFAVDLFAVGHKSRSQVRRSIPASGAGVLIAARLAARFYDDEVVIVHPNAPLEAR